MGLLGIQGQVGLEWLNSKAGEDFAHSSYRRLLQNYSPTFENSQKSGFKIEIAGDHLSVAIGFCLCDIPCTVVGIEVSRTGYDKEENANRFESYFVGSCVFVPDIGCVFKGIIFLYTEGIEAGTGRSVDHCGTDGVMGNLESKIDFTAAVHIILKILFQGSIFDFGLYKQVVPVALDADIIIIVAVDEGGIRKQAAVEDMVPTDGSGTVSVIDTELPADAEYIFSKVTREYTRLF